jgi:hypothetical protein
MSKTRGWVSVWILFSLLAGALVCVANGFDKSQDQREGSKFYALQVVLERNVQNANDSLGEPDGRSAEIQPDGQLEVLMEKILSASHFFGGGENPVCIDSGSIVGRGEEEFGLEGRFVWRDAQGDEQHEWVNLGVTATGFCVLAPPLVTSPYESGTGVDIVRITNSGAKSLFVDAVIGFITPSAGFPLPRESAI